MNAITCQDFMIMNKNSKLRLFLRNKRRKKVKSLATDKTVLYVHGTTQPSEAIFDLAISGVSFADYLAQHGYDVWYLNIRGYGQSEAPKVAKKYFATTDDALCDLQCALKHIFKLRKIKKINLMGWSWGTIIVGAYAAKNPKHVSRLILLSAPWLTKKADGNEKLDGKFWQEWTAETMQKKLRKGAPRGSKALSRSTRRAWEKALLNSQPEAAKQSPAKFRSPAGVLFDAAKFWRNGKAYYKPAKIRAKVLICWGTWDRNVHIFESQDLLDEMTHAAKKELRGIPKSTHLMQIEPNRTTLFRYVQNFLRS